MASRDEIIAFCDELLEIDRFEDFGPNGLQVPGDLEVERIATGVSANRELIAAAVERDAGLLLVHHGLFWDSAPRALSAFMAGRLRDALAAGMSIAGYHLPLDAHPEIGNNVLLRDGAGLDPDPEPFGEVKGRPLGVIGRAPGGIAPDELAARVGEFVGREPSLFGDGPQRIERVGIVTGDGASTLGEAVELRLDALVTGEISEPAPAEAREGGIHLLAAGHHATETSGIRRLGELVAERFSLEHAFIEIPNPV